MRVASPSTSARNPSSRVARLDVVESPEIEVLVLDRVGQLVHERHSKPRRELAAPNSDALGLGVVEREASLVLERAHRVDEIDVTRQQPDGTQLAFEVLQVFDVGVGQLALRRDDVAVLLGCQEVDLHRMVVEQAPLGLHELHEVGDTGIPLVGSARPPAARRHDGDGACCEDDRDARRDPTAPRPTRLPGRRG